MSLPRAAAVVVVLVAYGAACENGGATGMTSSGKGGAGGTGAGGTAGASGAAGGGAGGALARCDNDPGFGGAGGMPAGCDLDVARQALAALNIPTVGAPLTSTVT
jgi:hypothetical protein